MQYISYGAFDNFNKFIHISWHVWVIPDLLPDFFTPTANYRFPKWCRSRRLRMREILCKIIAVFWHGVCLARSEYIVMHSKVLTIYHSTEFIHGFKIILLKKFYTYKSYNFAAHLSWMHCTQHSQSVAIYLSRMSQTYKNVTVKPLINEIW